MMSRNEFFLTRKNNLYITILDSIVIFYKKFN